MIEDEGVIRFKPSEMARAIRSITTPRVAATLTVNQNGIYTLDMSEEGVSRVIVNVSEEEQDSFIFSSSAIEITEDTLIDVGNELDLQDIVFHTSGEFASVIDNVAEFTLGTITFISNVTIEE